MAPINIGVSVGFACAPEDTSDPDELHRKADAALYVAKAGGKGIHRRSERVATSAIPSSRRSPAR